MMRRILIVTESLQMNGVLGSLLGFLSALPKDRYIVELMSFDPHIPEWVSLPKGVHIVEAPIECTAGALYSRNAVKFCLEKRKVGLLVLRMVLSVLEKLVPALDKRLLYRIANPVEGNWDVACAYSMGAIGHFVRTKVNASQKILWIHTDPSIPELADVWKSYRKIAKDVSGIICVSDGVINAMKANYPELEGRLFCVHNVVDEAAIRAKANSGDIVPKRKDVVRLATVGRFCDVKNQSIVPEIAKEVMKRGHQIEWYLIGPGASSAKNDDLGGVLHYVESMTNPFAMMASADICVQLSKYEGWGLALTEGLVLGCYSIASDIPSFRDQIRDDMYGKLVPISVMDFADAICEAIESGRICADRAHYKVPWTAENTVREFERVIS